MEFNLEEFVGLYLAALRAEDTLKLVSLIATLPTDIDKQAALAGVIEGIKADPELMATAADVVAKLEEIKGENLVETQAEVLAPAIVQGDAPEVDAEATTEEA